VEAADFINRFRSRIHFPTLFFLIFIAALAIRLYCLDLKLFHHDEAVHAWFSYRLLTQGVYEYNPMYHGPLLYYVTAGMFALFGDSDLVARIVPAILGALLVPLLYPIYRLGYLNSRQTLIAAIFLALSPTLVYFSRFLRNDIFVVFFTLLLLVAFLLYLHKGELRYALLGAAAIGGGMSCKENMPIVLAIFGVYLLYLIWKQKITLPPRWKRDFLAGAVLVIGIMAILYSSFGQHPEILLDGWLKAIEHWTAMHQQQRLGGPPFFYLLLFLLYEVPILLLALFGTGQFLIQGTRYGRRPPRERSMHEIVAASLAQLRAGGELVDKNREFTRFCIFWMICSLAAYAYIGEKVPWLILHQLLPMIFVAVYKMTDTKTLIALVSCIFLIGMSWHVAFVPVDINEPIVQVQNSEDLREVMAMIDVSDSVAVATPHYWPLPWYYRGDRGEMLHYYQKTEDSSFYESGDYDLVICHDEESFASLESYEKRTYRGSYWFSYYDNKDRLLPYYLLRDGKLGSRNLDVFIRNGSAAAAIP
jgi:uncharacterized protein (TIGR03663 family)